MVAQGKPHLSIQEVGAWLAGNYAGVVSDLTPLGGGFWSSAYAYRVGNHEFVLRLSDMREGFEIDRAAMRFTSPAIPVPEIVEIGSAFDRSFAISRRHYGRFIETAPTSDSAAVTQTLATLLRALRTQTPARGCDVNWYDPEPSTGMTWHAWLRSGLVDSPDRTVHGWRAKLAADPRMDRLFQTCEERIEALLPTCPERRDLIHGDLLHQNVLVSDDARRVTAIFSWKCSALGDFLFDVAWCTFWSPWHPAIDPADLWQRTLTAPDLSEDDRRDAPLHHHCYELQIAASHFGWNVWTGNDQALVRLAAETDRLLDRGPLPA